MAKYHGKYQKSSRSRLFLWAGMGCSFMALACGCFIAKFLFSAAQASLDRRQAIQAYVTPAPSTPEMLPAGDSRNPPEEIPAGSTAVTQPAEEAAAPTVPPRFPAIDFAGLQAKSSAVVAWLQIPALEVIDYPVVLGQDNAYYVSHSWDGEERENGAIFLDFQNQGDFSQVHNILYGHCMKDGSMFQSLGKWEGPVFFDTQDRTLLLHLPEETRVYEIFAAERVNALDSRVYKTDYTPGEDWSAALKETLRIAPVTSQPAITQDSEVLTLSTCVGDMTRLVVHALCIEHVPR